MTPKDDDAPFSPIGCNPFVLFNKNYRGTKNDVENHVTKTLFRRSSAAAHQHDPNRSALQPMATHFSPTPANAANAGDPHAHGNFYNTFKANNFL